MSGWRRIAVMLLAAAACAHRTAPPPPAPAAVPPAPRPASAAPSPRIPEAVAQRYLALLGDATRAFEAKDVDTALRLIADAKKLLPAEPPAYEAAGIILYTARQAPAAAPEFKRAVELADVEAKPEMLRRIRQTTEQVQSTEEEKLLRRAYDATEAGHSDQALPTLQRALDMNPRNARTRYEIGYAMISLGRIDDAIPQLEEGRRINPVNRDLLSELQYCYAERKRFSELRGVISDRILVEGEQPAILHELGYAYAVTDNAELAIQTLEENVRRFPAYYLSHFTLGQLYCEKRHDGVKGRAHLAAFVDAAETARRKGARDETPAPPEKMELLLRDARKLQGSCVTSLPPRSRPGP